MRRSSPRSLGAFSLIELVVVIVIVGVVAAIAVPRFSSAASSSQQSAMLSNTRALQNAIDMYYEEHGQRSPAENPDGTSTTDPDLFVKRLLEQTDEFGDPGGLFGPYLRRIPMNVYNQLDTIRLGGASPGVSTHGWTFRSTSNLIVPDDAAGLILWRELINPGGNNPTVPSTPPVEPDSSTVPDIMSGTNVIGTVDDPGKTNTATLGQ